MDRIFTQDQVWLGGFYELNLELASASRYAVRQALVTMWNTPQLEGCYLRNDVEPSEQMELSPLDYDHEGHWYGVATLANGKRLACGTFSCIFKEYGGWTTLYIPLSALHTVYPVDGFPFNPKAGPTQELWIREVNAWFKDVAESIYPDVRFKIALIGYEVDILALKRQLIFGIPSERWDGLLIPVDGRLVWYPPTNYEGKW